MGHLQMGLPFTDSHLSVKWGIRPKAKAPRPAAGVLLRFADHDGDWFLLGKRARSLGGTWANLGGSLEPGEHPLAGALREFSEETDLPVSRIAGATIAQVIEVDDPEVPYTLFVIDVPDAFDDFDWGWEHSELAWIHRDDIAGLDLHRSFRPEWEALCG